MALSSKGELIAIETNENNGILVELLLLNERGDLKVHVKKPVCKVTVR